MEIIIFLYLYYHIPFRLLSSINKNTALTTVSMSTGSEFSDCMSRTIGSGNCFKRSVSIQKDKTKLRYYFIIEATLICHSYIIYRKKDRLKTK